MRTLITVAAALALLACGQAYGQFTVTYTLQLGGNNHAADYHNGGYLPYTPGSTDDDPVEHPAGVDVISWAAAVQVTGPDDVNAPSSGAANLVFDLELHKGTADGPLVAIGFTTAPTTTGGFYSTINDGKPGSTRTCAAAFPTVFDIGGVGSNGGTLVSAVTDGGPNMDFSTFPSTFGFPTGSTAAAGTLVGMGAGYKQMIDAQGTNIPGVGVVLMSDWWPCQLQGVKPLFEGQISTAGFETGTYVLVLKAGTGNNVIPSMSGDFPVCNPGVEGKFAVAATTVVGDTISFKVKGIPVKPDCTAPVLVAAQSMKTHGTAGDFGIDVFAKNIECRKGGLTKVVATFDKAVALSGAGAVTVSTGAVVSATASGKVVTVELSGSPNAGLVTLAFPGVITDAAAEGCVGTVASTSTLCARVLVGDADNNAVNRIADLVFIRDRSNATADATNFRGDIDCSGKLQLGDMVIIRDNMNATVAACP